MPNETLSMIETKGLVGAIEAADAMVKTADVALISYEKIGSDLVTVMVHRDVSAVKVPVDAGVAAADATGEVVSRHVIPRPHSDTKKYCRKLRQRMTGPIAPLRRVGVESREVCKG